MSPSISELMRALPELDEPAQDAREPLPAATMRPVPVGRWRRLRLLATLQAQIAAAYLFHWVRGWFQQADQRERMLAETHWKTALRRLDSPICSSRWSASATTELGHQRRPLPA